MNSGNRPLTHLKALIAEDSEDDLILIMRELRRGGYEMSFIRVDNEKDLAEALKKGPWDFVISDYAMPKLNGLDVVKAVRESGLEAPVIIVSGLMGEDFAVTAMKAGADDYVLKDRMFRLVPAIEREFRDYGIRREHKKAREEVFLLNRLLKTIIEVDKMLVRETDRSRILSETSRILVERAGFMMAWIGEADLSTGEIIPVAQAGGGFEGLGPIPFKREGAQPCHLDPVGETLLSGGHVICFDMGNEDCLSLCRNEAGARGYGSCASFGLKAGGKLFGNIAVYSSDTDIFTEKMIDLMDSLAADIGFAIQSLDEIAERKKAVLALKESEERLRTIFESAMDGMFVIDTEGRYVDVNLAGCRMVGYTRDEILSSDITLLLPVSTEDIEKYRALWATGGLLPGAPLRKKDGSTVWVDLAITPFKVGDRELVLGVKRDITGRKKAEEAIRESEERFRQIFEQNEDAQVLFEYGGCRVLDANPAAVALFWYSRDELAAFECPSFLAGEDVCEPLRKLTGAGVGFSIEKVRGMRKDGARVTVALRGQTLKLRGGRVVLCTIKDMTEMLRMEEEARNMQAKLIHANKMTSIGTLASGVAHEINNPNNFILFNSTLLSDAWKDAVKILDAYYRENGDFSMGGLPYSEMGEVVPELLSGITDGSRRIKGIVDTLKDFSRGGAGALDGEMDVNRAIRSSISMLSSQIMKFTDCFELSCAEGLPAVKGSSQKIEQVIINLVLNALQALPAREKGVKVSTYLDEAARQVVIEVKDDGAGMTREVLDRITEPFFTTRGERGGTGLGLSISYSIIREHNGTLEFSSAPGSGTTASIRLPLMLSQGFQG